MMKMMRSIRAIIVLVVTMNMVNGKLMMNEEYECDHCDNSDDENGGHKNDDKEYEMDRGDSS